MTCVGGHVFFLVSPPRALRSRVLPWDAGVDRMLDRQLSVESCRAMSHSAASDSPAESGGGVVGACMKKLLMPRGRTAGEWECDRPSMGEPEKSTSVWTDHDTTTQRRLGTETTRHRMLVGDSLGGLLRLLHKKLILWRGGQVQDRSIAGDSSAGGKLLIRGMVRFLWMRNAHNDPRPACQSRGSSQSCAMAPRRVFVNNRFAFDLRGGSTRCYPRSGRECIVLHDAKQSLRCVHGEVSLSEPELPINLLQSVEIRISAMQLGRDRDGNHHTEDNTSYGRLHRVSAAHTSRARPLVREEELPRRQSAARGEDATPSVRGSSLSNNHPSSSSAAAGFGSQRSEGGDSIRRSVPGKFPRHSHERRRNEPGTGDHEEGLFQFSLWGAQASRSPVEEQPDASQHPRRLNPFAGPVLPRSPGRPNHRAPAGSMSRRAAASSAPGIHASRGGMQRFGAKPETLGEAGADLLAAVDSDGFPSRWRLGKEIGRGSYGTVYKAMNLVSGEVFAVKRVPLPEPLHLHEGELARVERAAALEGAGPATPFLSSMLEELSDSARRDELKELVREVEVMRRLRHRHVVNYLGAEVSPDQSYFDIFTEFVPGGTLATLIREFGALDEDLCRAYCRQILLGIQYLHENGIVHRCAVDDSVVDVKPGNILVTPDAVAKVADFGCSRHIEGLTSRSKGSMEESLRQLRGTIPYMAPEVIRQSGHGFAADVWSIGCTVVELASGHIPWNDHSQPLSIMFHVASTGESPPVPDSLSNKAHDFLQMCFAADPEHRPSLSSLLRHPWIQGAPRSAASMEDLKSIMHSAGR